MSNYYRFAQAILSLPHMERLNADFDMGVEQIDSSLSDRLHMQYVFYPDSGLWHKLMNTKDLQLVLLKWYLRLKTFDFVLHDKANDHTLTDPD